LCGNGVGGSAFIGTDTALPAGTKGNGYSYGVAAEASTTQYANPLAAPTLGGKVILRGTYGDEEASISSTTTIADVNSYNLRSSDLIQSLKGEVVSDNIKVFATVEGARSSLNQTNAIFADFLPNPQVYLRGTVTHRVMRALFTRPIIQAQVVPSFRETHRRREFRD
jgi:hypothetical protein